MLKKSQLQWTAKTLVKNVLDGNVNFDCAIQRSYSWDKARKSLLINSLIEDYPIPPFFLAQNEDRTYDGLDGKQRTNTILTFMDNEWELEDDFIVTDGDGVEHNFSSHTFKDLPVWAQETIKDYSVTIIFFQDLTEDQYQEMFYRLNNGKPLTPVELTRVRMQALPKFQEMANHAVVDLVVTEKSKQKFNHENLAMQAWAVCFALDDHDDLSFETKTFRPFLEKAEVSDLQMKEMENYFNILYNMYCSCNQNNKTEKKIARNLKTRTHMVAMCKAISEALGYGYEIERLIEWAKVFFNGANGVSVDAVYNNASGGTATGTAKRKKIDERINAMIAHMNEYMKRIEKAEAEKRKESRNIPHDTTTNPRSESVSKEAA